MNDPSAGEVGGLFAGAVAMLVAIGHGLRWWLGWTDRRAENRAVKLDAWQRELAAREARFDERQDEYQRRIELELDKVRSEHAALFAGYQLIATELRTINPKSDALRRADELLRATFSAETSLPASFSALTRRLDNID